MATPAGKTRSGRATRRIVLIGIVLCLAYGAWSLHRDIVASAEPSHSLRPWLLLGAALLIALAFEFVNGFHDTANAVATVIYTHSMPPTAAVLLSGFFNFLGVLLSSGTVAYGIITLLPVELILQVGSSGGYAMVFALLIAAIVWNLGTWALGLPASSSHTLIGSVIGVGLANQLFTVSTGTSGVDWSQATKIGYALLLSPLVGFVGAGLLLLVLRVVGRRPELFAAPYGDTPPPWWIRALLVTTCSGVSFAHGSNDGQKGMGLIMLILIGTVPTAYALNRALPDTEIDAYRQVFATAAATLDRVAGVAAPATTTAPSPATAPTPPGGSTSDAGAPRATVENYLKTRVYRPELPSALASLTRGLGEQADGAAAIRDLSATETKNLRNDMYLMSESLRLLEHDKAFRPSRDDKAALKSYRAKLDEATKFIPTWVRVVVAFALGLGTLVGWKRIVVTVGEKIGKTRLTYGQGASAELVAALTIAAADRFGLPVSTTHVLSSGVAGTMAASGSGVQWPTVRNLLLAWILTLPVAVLLSGSLFWVFLHVF